MKPQSREELIKANWCVALRREGHRQCQGWLNTKLRNGQSLVCALGLLRETLPADHPAKYTEDHDAIGRAAGLEHWEVCEVIDLNDGTSASCVSFAKIADEIEAGFPSRVSRILHRLS